VTSPFEVLGIPRGLVARERLADGGAERILDLARRYTRALGAVYHPDVYENGGEIMDAARRAYEELKNPAAFEFLADLYVGEEQGRQAVDSVRQRERAVYDRRRFDALSRSLWSADQFALFGISAPSSVILTFDPGRIFDVNLGIVTIILEIRSHQEVRLFYSDHPTDVVEEIVVPTPFAERPVFHPSRGQWSHDYWKTRTRVATHYHERLREYQGTCRVIGGAHYDDLTEVYSQLYGEPDEEWSLVTGGHTSRAANSWASAPHAWYLGACKPSIDEGDHVIVMEDGGMEEPKFSLIGPVRGVASLPPSK